MKQDIYFENVENIGNLYLKYILWEFDFEPIVFVCEDDKDSSYLCFYSEAEEERDWIITQTNLSIICDLIKQKIDLLNALRKYSEKVWLVAEKANGDITSTMVEINNIDPLFLPKKGIFLKYCDKDLADKLLRKEQWLNCYMDFTFIQLNNVYSYTIQKKFDDNLEKNMINFITSFHTHDLKEWFAYCRDEKIEHSCALDSEYLLAA